jgi:hypothetical protein
MPLSRVLVGWSLIALLVGAASGLVTEARGARAPAFSFIFEDENGTRIDTAQRRYTKDLVIGRDTTITLVLSPAGMKRVRAKMVAIGFFDLPEPHPPLVGCRSSQDPHTTIRISATDGTRTRLLRWDTQYDPCHTTPAWKGLDELSLLIRTILDEHPRSRALPAPRGFYL